MSKIGKLCCALLASVPFVSLAVGLDVVELPAGYEQLEYIDSTGYQYIDLQITPDSTMTCSLEFEYLGMQNDAVFFLGSRNAYKDHAFYLTHQASGSADAGFAFARGDKVASSKLHTAGYHTASLTAEEAFVLDDRTVDDLSDVAEVANNHSIYLFTANNGGSASTQASKMRLYSCTLTKSGEPVRSLIPARYFGVAGVYDLVEGKFYPPKRVGTGAGLVAGPPKIVSVPRVMPSGYTQLEYVSSHGKELLDTEIVPDNETEMHARLTPHDDKDVHIIGSRKGFQQQSYEVANLGGLCMYFDTTYGSSGLKYLGEMIDISLYKKRFYVRNGEYGDFSNRSSFVGAGSMYVFNINNNGSPHDQYATIDLAELQIVTNGVPARDFVAAKDAQNAPGLYDFVTGRFFTCSKGTLTAGPEKKIEADETVVFADERYEDDTLLLTVTRQGGLSAATDITLAYGSEIGGDTVEDWEGSRVVGHFNQGQNSVELAIDDLPDTARFGRLFTENGASAAIEIYTILGRYVRPSLPSGYRAVEFIRSSAVQKGYIIDTGYVCKRQTRIECVVNVEKKTCSTAGFSAVFGSRLGSTWTFGSYAFFVIDGNNFAPRYNRGDAKVVGEAGAFPYGTKVKVITQGDKAEWYSDPEGEMLGELTTAAMIDDGVNTMAIFDLNDQAFGSGLNISGSTVAMALYSFQMLDGGHVSRDFVPCLNKNGEPGLYETITGAFHGNRGTMNVDFETDLPTTLATYTWTGAGASANWTDAANWSCSSETAANVPGWSSTVVFPSGTWTVNLDRPVGVKALDLSAADVRLRLVAKEPGTTLTARSDLQFGAVSDSARQGLWLVGSALTVWGDLVAGSGASELPLHFVVPKGGYSAAPFTVAGKSFTDAVRGRIYTEAKSPALKVDGTTQVPLVFSVNYDMAKANVTLEPLPKRHPTRDSAYVWDGVRGIGATLEGYPQGLILFLK